MAHCLLQRLDQVFGVMSYALEIPNDLTESASALLEHNTLKESETGISRKSVLRMPDQGIVIFKRLQSTRASYENPDRNGSPTPMTKLPCAGTYKSVQGAIMEPTLIGEEGIVRLYDDVQYLYAMLQQHREISKSYRSSLRRYAMIHEAADNDSVAQL